EASGGAIAISDTIQIIGNRIYCNATYTTIGITISSQKYFYQINNNFFSYQQRAILISGWTNKTVGNHEIINNSFKRLNYNTTSYALYLSGIPTGGVLKIYNNLFDGYYSGSPTAIYLTSMTNGILFISYNAFNNTFSYYITGTTNDGTNITGGTFTVDSYTGQPTAGNYINAGHPDTKYYDHDLSRNDLGCYGGSMSARNFFPAGDANHNRVYMLSIPNNVYTGNPIKVKADSFDK
ncbi:MAG: hypothetical protein PHE33_09485, partial [Bacteroidales bacterium]|nr:hypothetical protein [Bacteroidales bacterium]